MYDTTPCVRTTEVFSVLLPSSSSTRNVNVRSPAGNCAKNFSPSESIMSEVLFIVTEMPSADSEAVVHSMFQLRPPDDSVTDARSPMETIL